MHTFKNESRNQIILVERTGKAQQLTKEIIHKLNIAQHYFAFNCFRSFPTRPGLQYSLHLKCCLHLLIVNVNVIDKHQNWQDGNEIILLVRRCT